MFKNRLMKTIVSTVMAVVLVTTPMASINTNITAIAAEADSNGFVIEDGVLTSYEGNGGAVEIPSSVTKIGAGAFSGNTQITSVTISGSVTVIDERAFYGCSGLQSVTFTTGLKSIEKWAFYGCNSITSLVLPEGLESIGGLAFYNCNELQTITIPKSVTSIGSSAISQNASKNMIMYGYAETKAEEYAIANNIDFEEIGSENGTEQSNNDTQTDNGITVTGKSKITSVKQTSYYSLSVNFAKYKGASYYKILYSTDKKFSSKKSSSIWTKNLTCSITGLDKGKTYYVKIRAYTKKSGKALGQFSAVTSKKLSTSFKSKIIEIEQNENDEKKVLIEYDKVPLAEKYVVYYATSEAKLKKSPKSKSVTTTKCSVTDLTPGKTYYFRVRAFKKNGTTPLTSFSSIRSVKLVNTSINSITKIEQVGTSKVKVTFSRMTGVTGYQINYATNADVSLFSDGKIYVKDNGGKSATQSVIVKGLIPGKTYYFISHACSMDASGNIDFYFGADCEVEKIKLDVINTKKIYSGDIFSFENPSIYGYLYEQGCYYKALKEKAKNHEEVEKYIYNSGELISDQCCFGMSCIFVLNKAEALKPEFYNCNLLNQMKKPSELGLEQISYNLINYYQISQLIGKCATKRANYDKYDETPNNKKIVEAIKSSNYPVVIGYNVYGPKNKTNKIIRLYGHAVVAVDVTEDSKGYIIKIWDPDRPDKFEELVISNDFSEAEFSNKYWWNTQPNYTYMKYVLTYEDSKNSYDEINIQDYVEYKNLTAKEAIKKQNLCNSTISGGKIKKKDLDAQATQEEYMMLRTNYMNFTITCSNRSYAVVEYGDKVQGDLDVSFYEIWNEYGEEYDVEFMIPALKTGESYSITPKQNQESNVSSDKELDFYQTKLTSRTSNGYYAKVTSKVPVILTVTDDGNMKTSTENGEAVAQTLKTAFDDPARMAEGVSSTIVQGTDTGFSINSENKKVQIRSDNKVDVNVTVRGDFQSLDMGKVSTESGMVEISGSENSYVITDAGGKELVRKEMGYIVRFNLMSGQDMDGLDHVPSGSLIQEPQNITREGYTFEGWYTSRTFEEDTKWDFSVNTVTSDLDLYAKWIEIPQETPVIMQSPAPTVLPTKEPTTKPSKPSKVTLKNSAKKTLKVTWKKVSKATGYKVVYSTDKKFSKSKTKTVTVGKAKNTVTIKKLKKGKTYYVKVRAYKKSGKTTVYGKYSTVKKIKIKK